MKLENKLRSWVIYDHPKDHPDYFIARLWKNNEPTTNYIASTSYEVIEQQMLKYGFVKLQSHESDDPVIMEVWL